MAPKKNLPSTPSMSSTPAPTASSVPPGPPELDLATRRAIIKRSLVDNERETAFCEEKTSSSDAERLKIVERRQECLEAGDKAGAREIEAELTAFDAAASFDVTRYGKLKLKKNSLKRDLALVETAIEKEKEKEKESVEATAGYTVEGVPATPSATLPLEESAKRTRSGTVTESSVRGSVSPVKKLRLGGSPKAVQEEPAPSSSTPQCNWCRLNKLTCVPRKGRKVGGKNPSCELCHTRKTRCENPPGRSSVSSRSYPDLPWLF